jgi:hypothetical protein
VKSRNFILFFGKFDCLKSVVEFFLKKKKKRAKKKKKKKKKRVGEEEEDTFTWKYFKLRSIEI